MSSNSFLEVTQAQCGKEKEASRSGIERWLSAGRLTQSDLSPKPAITEKQIAANEMNRSEVGQSVSVRADPELPASQGSSRGPFHEASTTGSI